MKSSGVPVSILYEFIIASTLKNLISGKVYRGKRPKNSVLEDIVINSLGITGGWLQKGVCNVNLYVPDILVTRGGSNEYLPNVDRLDALATLGITTLKEFHSQQYSFRFTNEFRIEEPDAKQSYVNLRIGYQLFPS